MKLSSRYLVAFAVIAIMVVVGVIFIGQERNFRRVQNDIEALQVEGVDHLIVYEGDWPRDRPRTVYDRAKIALVLESLRTGNSYSPSHDRHNGFERFVIIEPQGIELSIYQKIDDDSAVIVSLGDWDWHDTSAHRSHYGYLRCKLPEAWKDL